MSSSRDRVEDTYESQNDQRLDELHAKVRTLRGVTTDINDDVERQNLMLDDTGNRFGSFGASLTQTSRRAAQAFGIEAGSLTTYRLITYVVAAIFSLWLAWKVLGYLWHGSAPN